MTWVYRIRAVPGATDDDPPRAVFYTVGFYAPVNRDDMVEYEWEQVARFDQERQARSLVNYLNGGSVSVSDAI